MKIINSKISNVFIIESDPHNDNRGYFNRIFCQKEMNMIQPGIIIAQINHSMTKHKGTIRGMHYQNQPNAELKIVRCIKGSIFDVAVDIRRNSSTFFQWHGEILSAQNMKALVIPEGCAHGFQTLEDNTEMIYMNTKFYAKESENTIRYNEPLINIQWPLECTQISEKDMSSIFLSSDFQGIEI